MTQVETVENIGFLTRSTVRVRVLQAVRREGTVTRSELREEFDASRTTIQRNLNALAERGWIKSVNNEYSITPCGRMVAEGFDIFRHKVRTAERLRPFLQWVSPANLSVNLAHLADAEVVTAEPSDPYAPVNMHVEALKTAERVRAVLPSVGRDAVEVAAERAKAGVARYELVVADECLRVLLEDPKYAKYIEDVLDTQYFSVAVTEREIPYYLGILDGTIQIGVEDDDGIPRALVETDSEPVRVWARETLSSYFEGTREVGVT